VQKQIAVWNTDLKLWSKPNEVLFSEHLELFSETWPTSGMTLNGVAYELPMQVPHINASEYSSQHTQLGGGQSLPTPTVSDQYTGNLASTQQKLGSMHSVTLAQVFHKPELFPTPTTRDYKDGSADHQRDGKVQTDTVARAIFSSGEVALMGTPRTSSANGSTPKQVAAGAPKARIEDQVLLTNWGKFEPAIRRWETILGRPAPEPTKPDGKDNNHRLSSKFTEWMMGLPDGWITGHDLKRNDELKLAGNGVVPQQAELALRLLLELPEER
jgi:DNA (cytosine-5)-methyltransferase 1